ncbi:MAG: hypothetical protein CFE31_04750 [Rhizobiales bacterium PAR1]|nr:MAG: hypothetical protein CFE31_04750 [Rhizobiales bacterium PAR1]
MRPKFSTACAAGFVAILALIDASSMAVNAANAPIDPVPGSLTLGEIMEREQWNNGPRAPLRPVRAPAEPVAEATLFPAQEAPVVQAPAASRVVRQVYPLPKR